MGDAGEASLRAIKQIREDRSVLHASQQTTTLSAEDAEAVIAQLSGSRWRRKGTGGEHNLSVAHDLMWRDDDSTVASQLFRPHPNVILTNGWWVSHVTYTGGRRLDSIEWHKSGDTVVWSRCSES